MTEIAVYCVLALFFLPTLAYLVVKSATAGYLNAMNRFSHNPPQESRNGDGSEKS